MTIEQSEQRLVEKILNHVERCCGPLSREVCEVPGDDDYSILKHNIGAILRTSHAVEPVDARQAHLSQVRASMTKGDRECQFERREHDANENPYRRYAHPPAPQDDASADVRGLVEDKLCALRDCGCGCPCCNYAQNMAEEALAALNPAGEP